MKYLLFTLLFVGCASSKNDARMSCESKSPPVCFFADLRRECSYNSNGCYTCGCVAKNTQSELEKRSDK